MLDYLASDPRTRAILLYIEAIESPRKFMSAARAAARNKPVILVKAGRSHQGQRAAASHTGALAGSDMVYDAAIARAGMLRVDTLLAIVPGGRDAGALSHQSQRRARDPDQRRRRRRGGGRRCFASRRQAGRSGRTDAAAARCAAAGQLVARQPGGHHRRCAGGALRAGTAGLERRPSGRLPCCSSMRRRPSFPAPRSRAPWCRWPARRRTPPDGLLAGRGVGGRGAPRVPRRRHRQLSDARKKRCARSRCWSPTVATRRS